MKYFRFIYLFLWLNCGFLAYSSGQLIKSIVVEGNARVGAQAVTGLIYSKEGEVLDKELIKKDIKEIYSLGYFSDIDVYTEDKDEGLVLIYVVKEKSAIGKISFVGMEEVSEESVSEELLSKRYTIIDEQKIQQDLRLIEKKYQEKGFFLVDVSYRTKAINENELELIFVVSENGKILVAEVNIIGNSYFTDADILSKLLSKPYTSLTAITSGSIYNREFVTRDVEFLAYYYKDQGFADVSISSPVIYLDRDRSFARITIKLEEGSQYRVDSISVGGDVGPDLYSAEELMEQMKLKSEAIFRASYLHKDVDMLVEKYGDLGYAYVDINPIPDFDKEKKTVKLHFEISKGKKVYFGKINIKGNTKTRDNVIRRELEVHDSELFSGTRLTKSKRNINRLGFFEELKIQRKPSETESDVVDLEVSVKEQSTGQLQASVGFSPGGQTVESWFAQGRYDEKNQFGRGWALGVTGKWSGSDNVLAEISFSNPRVMDSQWYLGGSFSYDSKMMRYASDYEGQEKEIRLELTVGRTLFELVRGFVSYGLTLNKPHEENTLLPSTERSIASSVSFRVSRYDLDNLLSPTEGLSTSISYKFVGGILQGNQKYMESKAEISYYFPVDFTDKYRTYFKFNVVGGHLWKFMGHPLPYAARYRLGGYNDLRGYMFGEVSPVEKRATSPVESAREYYKGGDKKLYTQFEYFLPIIREANIKGLVFIDSGMVYEEGETIDFTKFKYDAGFGFRWKTPIAPFRFEWAYPFDMKTKKFGDMQFVFSLGY